MHRILVLRGGALGDFIVTLPMLAALRAAWTHAEIDLVGNATAAELGARDRLIDRIHSQHEARWAGLYGDAPLPPALRLWLEHFDLVIACWPDPDGELARRFPVRSGQRFVSVPATPAIAPAAAHFTHALRPLGITDAVRWYALKFPSGREAAATPTKTIAVHPGSGSSKKNWPADRWRDLIHRLPAEVLVIVGDAEAAAWPDAALATRPGVRVARNLPLPHLAAELARCGQFVGHDSGISHLAAACGVPSLLLFGPTDPAMWAPPAPFVRVLRSAPQLSDLPVDDVLAALPA